MSRLAIMDSIAMNLRGASKSAYAGRSVYTRLRNGSCFVMFESLPFVRKYKVKKDATGFLTLLHLILDPARAKVNSKCDFLSVK